MAKQQTIDDQANTSAPGAEAVAENTTAEQPATLLVSETPQWVQLLLDSNVAVITSNEALINSNASLECQLIKIVEALPEHLQSNQEVIDSLTDLKDRASRTVGNYNQADGSPVVTAIDPDADYEVAEGKSFRDSKDFTKEYTSGDDVTHLDADVLQRLFAQGLIQEA